MQRCPLIFLKWLDFTVEFLFYCMSLRYTLHLKIRYIPTIRNGNLTKRDSNFAVTFSDSKVVLFYVQLYHLT